jgi:hypothetical protein
MVRAKRTPLDPAVEEEIRDRLDHVLRAAEPRLERAIKWRRPTYTVNGDWHHWLCGIETSQGAVHLWFHKGGLLDDPAGVLQPTGSSRYGRRLTYHDPREVDAAVIAPLLGEAVRKQRVMLDEA